MPAVTNSSKLMALIVFVLVAAAVGLGKGVVKTLVRGDGVEKRTEDALAAAASDATAVEAVRTLLKERDVDASDGIRALAELAGHRDAVVRLRAIRALREIYGAKAVQAAPELRKALQDRDGRVQAEAALALEALGERPSLAGGSAGPAIVERLASDDPAVREAAFADVRGMGGAGVQILGRALQEPRCRLDAAVALAGIGGDEARPLAEPVLSEFVRGRDREAGRKALDALQSAGWDSAPLLIEGLESIEPDRQIWAFGQIHEHGLLDRIGPEHDAAATAVARVLGGPEGPAREAAEQVLRRIGRSATFRLLQGLEDEDLELRRGAIRGLGFVGADENGELIEALYRIWKEAPEEETRDAAREALESIQVSGASLNALAGRWNSPDHEESRIALSLLARVAVESEYASQMVLAALERGGESAADTVFGTFERIGDRAIPVLGTIIETLDSASRMPEVRARAERTLEAIRKKSR